MEIYIPKYLYYVILTMNTINILKNTPARNNVLACYKCYRNNLLLNQQNLIGILC